MKANPLKSEGARLERRAMRDMLRRKLSVVGTLDARGTMLNTMLLWVLLRQKRYDAKPGGLGK